MNAPLRRWLVRGAQVGIIGFVLWQASRELVGQWADFRARGGTLAPAWGPVALSAVMVLATYALLVHAWRALVAAWGTRLSFGAAARIWFVSNLGRYVPYKIWSIAAMGMLARQAGVAPVAAAGSAVLGTIVNLAAGFAVLLLAGSRVPDLIAPGSEQVARGLGALAAGGLLLLPWLLPTLVRGAARVLRRELTLGTVPRATLAWVVLANVAAWVGYGSAFRVLAYAFFPGSSGNWVDYLAVFTGSYLAGYLALIVPGGLGVREVAMVAGLTGLGLTGVAEAWVLAFASRLWLTVLELLPGLVFLARDPSLRVHATSPDVPS
jgi:uncharacterized membrane protein YbhN (UPF0104 family)